MSAPSGLLSALHSPDDGGRPRARPDRRRRGAALRPIPPALAGLGLPFAAGFGLLLGVAAGFWALAAVHTRLRGPHPAVLSDVLAAATAALAAAFFALCAVRRRVSGQASALLLGWAVLLFGTFCVALPELALPIAGRAATDAYVRSAQVAGLVTSSILFALAALRSDRDSAPPTAVVATGALALAGAAAAAGGLHPLRTLLPRLPTAQPSAVAHGAPVAASVVLAAAWLLVATACAAAGLARRRPLLTWSALMLLALAASDLGLAFANGPTHVWIVGSGVLRLLGVGLAVVGTTVELERAFVEQRARLLDVEVAASTSETRWRLYRAQERDRDHDLRSTLVAIEGAALTLERHYDTLTDLERDRLTAMLSSGVDRLQRLVVEQGRARAAFVVADVVRPFVGNLVAEGENVDVELPEDMMAYGSPAETAEVVRQLLDDARRRAPGGTITVTGGREGQAVVVRVGDHRDGAGGAGGSGPPRTAAALVATTPDLPAALHVASRLMRDQGGALWVEAEGSRCSVALSLPAPLGVTH